MNVNGTPGTLVASHPGNTHRGRHGVYSRSGRMLAPRAEEITAQLLDAPLTRQSDVVAAEELGSMLALAEAIDTEIASRGLVARGNRDRLGLLKIRVQLSRRLYEALAHFGATPRSRAELARQVAEGGLAAEIARRRSGRGSRDVSG